MSHPQIKFGTDGWRGVIADDFTFANVRTAAKAIAAYIHAKEDPNKGICIGYDTRYGSKAFALAPGGSGGGERDSSADGQRHYASTPALSLVAAGRGRAGS